MPGGVSNLGWESGPPGGPITMSFPRMKCVNALYPGNPSSG